MRFRFTLIIFVACAIIALVLLTSDDAAPTLDTDLVHPTPVEILSGAAKVNIPPAHVDRSLHRIATKPKMDAPQYGIPVLVVNEAGEPQTNVPLALWTVINEKNIPWKQRRTNNAGHAFFEMNPSTGSRDFDCRLGFPFPCGDAQAFDFRFKSPPTQLLTLTLPPLGSMEVQLLDIDGNPWTRPTEIRLTTPQASPAADLRYLRMEGNGIGALTSDAHGLVTFPCLANQALKLLGAFDNPWGKWELKRVFAPSEAGEVVTATLQIIEPKPVLKFRLVDPMGNPIIHREWSGRIVNYTGTEQKYSPGIFGRFKQTTDGYGYSEIPVQSVLKGKPWHHRILRLRCRPSEVDSEMAADHDISADFQLGLHDLGDVTLKAPTALVSGRVTSKPGLALQGLTLNSKVDWSGNHDSLHNGFLQDYPHSIILREDGSFLISGSTELKRMRLKITAADHYPVTLNLDVPTTQVLIELQANLSVFGQIESEKAYDLSQLLYFFESDDFAMPRPEPPDFESHYLGHLAPQKDGHFQVDHIVSDTPGRLTIYQGTRRQPIIVLDNVAPAAKGVAQDPRLNPLRLPKFNTYQFHAVDTSGMEVSMLRYRILESTMASEFNPADGMANASNWGSPSYTLTSPLPQVLVGVYALGYRYQEVTLMPGETELVLDKALQVRVKLNAPLVAPIGTRMRVKLKSEEAAGLAERSLWLPAFYMGTLPAIDFPGPGNYRIELELQDKKTRKMVNVLWDDGQSSYTFYVQDQTEQSIQIPFPTSGILDAAKSWDQK